MLAPMMDSMSSSQAQSVQETDLTSSDALDVTLGVVQDGVLAIPGVGAFLALGIGWFRNRRRWSALEADRAAHKTQTANIKPEQTINIYVNGEKVEKEIV